MPTPEPSSGRFDGGIFLFPLRVYYEDTDAAGIVYYANYLKFAERARSEMLRAFGTDNARLMTEAGITFQVRRCSADYRRPARLDDHLVVRTRVGAVRGASFSADHLISRGDLHLVSIDVRLACVTAAGRPARIPEALRTVLVSLEHGNQR